MSRNVFINSSVLNCSGERLTKLLAYIELNVKNPKAVIDENMDMVIQEDFDRRHIKAIAKFMDELSKEENSDSKPMNYIPNDPELKMPHPKTDKPACNTDCPGECVDDVTGQECGNFENAPQEIKSFFSKDTTDNPNNLDWNEEDEKNMRNSFEDA